MSAKSKKSKNKNLKSKKTGSGGVKDQGISRKNAIILIVTFILVGGALTIRSFAATLGAQQFATEMYQRCFNTMKTSGSDYDFWTNYIDKYGKNQAWAAFVEAANKNTPHPCSYPYPPISTSTTPTRTTPSKRPPSVTPANFVSETKNRLDLSNAFVTNSGKELSKAKAIQNKSVVQQSDLKAIQTIASNVSGWVEMNKNFQSDVKSYISRETNANTKAWLTAMLQSIEGNQNKIYGNLLGILDTYGKAVEKYKLAIKFFTPPTPTAPVPASQVGSPSACAISGGVHLSILSKVNDMCNAAKNDGVILSGSGWRDTQRQIQLRIAHCGSSHYAIYQMPAGSCRPPTAIPGTSQHEYGLAIDFSNCHRGSACFNWLSGHAAQFGFYNLPSESWHWSTTGH